MLITTIYLINPADNNIIKREVFWKYLNLTAGVSKSEDDRSGVHVSFGKLIGATAWLSPNIILETNEG